MVEYYMHALSACYIGKDKFGLFALFSNEWDFKEC